MANVRTGIFEFRGVDAPVIGEDLRVGQKAPEFSAQNQQWETVKALETTRGKVRILGSMPSLHTSVCDRETRRFNEEAAALSDDINIILMSMDLPYMINNWCAAAGVDRVLILSDHMSAEFGEKYGVLLQNQRIFRRAIFVIDRDGKVVYADYMQKMGDEPDYEEVLSIAKAALGK